MIPNFAIIGAQKLATTFLQYVFLKLREYLSTRQKSDDPSQSGLGDSEWGTTEE